MGLLKKIEAAEILYEEKPEELKKIARTVLVQSGVQGRAYTYLQEAKDLLKDAGIRRKYMKGLARHKEEFNKSVSRLEEDLDIEIDLKTKPYKERIDPIGNIFRGIFYGATTLLGYSATNNTKGIVFGFILGFSTELLLNSRKWNENEDLLLEKAEKLDQKRDAYLEPRPW